MKNVFLFLHENMSDIFVVIKGTHCGAIFFYLFSLARKLRS